MSDNLRIGPDARINHALTVLRDGRSSGNLAEEVHLMPGIRLLCDPALQISGRFDSPPGRVLEIEARMDGPGNWCALHLEIGAPDLGDCGFVGLAARLSAPKAEVLHPALRSGTAEGFVDCFFDKHMLALPDPASHIDALPARDRETLPRLAPWRELVLFLPLTGFSLALHDLRFFAV